MEQMEIPHCDCGGVIKPDVVFFGEAVRDIEKCILAAGQSKLMLVLGSSLVVYPAAMLPFAPRHNFPPGRANPGR